MCKGVNAKVINQAKHKPAQNEGILQSQRGKRNVALQAHFFHNSQASFCAVQGIQVYAWCAALY